VEDQLFALFKNLINGDPQLLKAILSLKDSGLKVRDNIFHFSLPGLHCLLSQGGGEKYNYNEFRQNLYSGRLNQRLADLGYRVEIHFSTGKVETNTYKLLAL